MTRIINARILASIAMLLFVGTVVASSTGAFFSDTETSTGNTFTAGSLDLKVDSTSHYNGNTCVNIGTSAPNYVWQGNAGFPISGTPCNGTWAETDLGPTHKFFNLTDIKPGDEGEDTISLHVYDNDAWGRFVISNVTDYDNSCTEPEDEAAGEGCTVLVPELLTPGAGELREAMNFYAWLDQGATPGFQCNNPLAVPTVGPCAGDPTEGDNIQQIATEPTVITPGTVDAGGETHNIWPALAAVRATTGACVATPTNGHNNYGLCHGLAVDGRMVGSTTYYFGLAWDIPTTVGNEAQTDSLSADMSFQVVQHRNNPSQTF